jgi:hypothetical protein
VWEPSTELVRAAPTVGARGTDQAEATMPRPLTPFSLRFTRFSGPALRSLLFPIRVLRLRGFPRIFEAAKAFPGAAAL